MEKHGLKEFVQTIQNKISIAVAIAVIRSTPSHITAREYAKTIQEQFQQRWMKRKEVSIFEEKLLHWQQCKIFNQITDLILPATFSQDFEDNSEDIPDICTDLVLADSCVNSNSDSDSDTNENIHNNIRFIQSMTQLKFAVESSKTLDVDDIHSLIQPNPSKNKTTSEGIVKKLQHSEDSGFGDSGQLYSADSMKITSTVFRFVTHSVKTEIVIQKCIGSLLKYVENKILFESASSFNLWKGSLLEHLVSILKEVSDNLICSEAVTNFVVKNINKIWEADEINQYDIWEYQLKMLKEFCINAHTSESVINILIDKLNILADKISSGNIYSEDKVQDLRLVEKVPLFLNLLSVVLTEWKNYKKPLHPPISEKSIPSFVSVTDLWKKNWNKRDEDTISDVASYVDIVTKWKTICEKLVISSSDCLPLISIQMWEIIEILNSCIQNR